LFLVAGLQGIITERADIGTPEARNEKQEPRNQKPVTSCQLPVASFWLQPKEFNLNASLAQEFHAREVFVLAGINYAANSRLVNELTTLAARGHR
jgi:hypothetical protein